MFGGTYIIVLSWYAVKYNLERRFVFVDSCKYTPFGLCVKTELLKRGKKQKWLEEECLKLGAYADSGYLDKIFKGKRNAPKTVAAICEILGLPQQSDYKDMDVQ